MKRFFENYSDLTFYRNYWNNNKRVIFYTFLLAVVAFGYELLNFTLSIDDELQAFSNAIDDVTPVLTGRWGLYLLSSLITPQSILPFLPTLLALVCISATAILFLTTEENPASSALVFSLIFVTNPVHAFYLPWNGAMFYAFGMALTVVAYISFKMAVESNKPKWQYYLITIVSLGFAISIYQALLANFMVLGAYYLFNNQFNNTKPIGKSTIITVFRIFAVTALALVFYKSGDVAARNFLFEGRYLNDTTYLDNWVRWGKMPLKDIFWTLLKYSGGHILGMKSFANMIPWGLRTTVFIIILLLVFILTSRKSGSAKWLSLLLLVALLLSPFTVFYLNGWPLPTRSLMGLPLMIGLVWMIVYRNSGKVLKRILIAVAVVILFNNTYINTRMFFSSYVSWQADRDMANRIIERIYNLDPPEINGLVKVSFIGSYQHPQNTLFVQSDVFGASFFWWGDGSSNRIKSLFKTIGINNLQMVKTEQTKETDNQIEVMPVWPSKGSVKLIDNVVFVKLSEKDKNSKLKTKR